MQEGAWLLYIFVQNHSTQGYINKFTYLKYFDITWQAACFQTSSIAKSPKCLLLTELPSWQRYLAKIIQPFLKRAFEWDQPAVADLGGFQGFHGTPPLASVIIEGHGSLAFNKTQLIRL